MKVAIFGGTFDPIHDAHIRVARLAAERFGLRRVLFVPAAAPPHKQGSAHAPYDDRMRMVELACAGIPGFEASRLEEGTERSYSIDTIEKLRPQLAPGDALYFLIGADAFADIRTWHRWHDVARAIEFIVVSRPGYQYDVPTEVRAERLDTAEFPESSSAIRVALARGEEPVGLAPAVREYIARHGLYATS